MARMNHPRYRYYSFFPSLILLALPNAIVQNDQVSQMNIFEKTRDLSDIKAKGMPGFLIRGDVRAWAKKDTIISGKDLSVCTPEAKWKEAVVFPASTRFMIVNGTQNSQVRTIE